MAAILTAEVLQDELAISLARALAVANKRARESGIDVLQSLITITQRAFDGQLLWRINYGPKNYVGRRGGVLWRWRNCPASRPSPLQGKVDWAIIERGGEL